MRFVNCLRTSGRFIFLALIVTLLGQLVNAEYVIYESATMGQTDQITSRSSKPTQPLAVETIARAARTYEPVKGIQTNNLGCGYGKVERTSDKFAEVEILLDDQLSLEDIAILPRAPASNLEILDSPKRVRVQLPASHIKALADNGTQIITLKEFIFVEGRAAQATNFNSGATTMSSCSGPYEFGQSSLNVYIRDNTAWYGSGINFSSVPGHFIVTCIDVHYEVRNLSFSSIVDVELSDEDYQSYTYILVDEWWGGEGDIAETMTGITAFNGKMVSQAWYLWAADIFANGSGYIDNWWIKLYYRDPSNYCDASGSNIFQYIKGVEVGSINNIPTDNHIYADYTSMSTTMRPGDSYPITITRGNPWDDVYDKCGLWVDWNQDKDFYDSGESIPMSLGVDPCTFAGTITPPAGATLGNTRMRVRIVWNETLSPCGVSSYGEVEDYTINVSTAPAFVTISGYVKTGNGIGIKDVLVSFSTGGTDTTDVDGYYERTLSSPWSGTITPSKSGWAFEPADRAYANLTTDISDADFTGAHAVYGGGKGTADDPYLIFTASQMNTIGLHHVDLYSHFKLMADIDLGSYTGDSFNIIGGPLSKFQGVFDGNDHTISNFTYTSTGTNCIGLFGYIEKIEAKIKNLGLIDPVVNGGTGDYIGTLAAYLQLGSIRECYVRGGSVSGNNHVGGLVGYNGSGVIFKSCTSADVSATNNYAGGLMGYNGSGVITMCYAAGDVWSTNDYVGGLAGFNSDGGISDCFAKGSVSGDIRVGGLLGSNEAMVVRCYSVGPVTGSGSNLGGLIGQQVTGATENSFWDKDTSGLDSSAGGTRKTTMEMYNWNTYLIAGWDFVTPVWKMNCDGMSYPKLNYWQPVLGDFGCPDGVDMRDFAVVGAQWQQPPGSPSADIAPEGGDGIVNWLDLAAQVDNWLTGF